MPARCGGNLQVVYDYRLIAKGFTASRSKPIGARSLALPPHLPVAGRRHLPAVQVGWRLIPGLRLGAALGLPRLYVRTTGNPRRPWGPGQRYRRGARPGDRAAHRGSASTGNAAASWPA